MKPRKVTLWKIFTQIIFNVKISRSIVQYIFYMCHCPPHNKASCFRHVRTRQQGAIRPPCGPTAPYQTARSHQATMRPNHTKPSDHSTQEPVLIIGDQCVSTCMLVCVCESGLHSEYGSWNPEDIYREKKQEWHTPTQFQRRSHVVWQTNNCLPEWSLDTSNNKITFSLVGETNQWVGHFTSYKFCREGKKNKTRLNSLLKQFTQILG